MEAVVKRRLSLLTLALALAAAGSIFPAAARAEDESGPDGRETVGRHAGRVVLPLPQTLTPLGRQVELPGMRPQALALSPDGRLLAVSGKSSELVILDPGTGAVRQRVPLPRPRIAEALAAVSTQFLEADTKGQLSYTGLIFAPTGGTST